MTLSYLTTENRRIEKDSTQIHRSEKQSRDSENVLSFLSILQLLSHKKLDILKHRYKKK